MTKRMIIMLILTGLVFSGIFGYQRWQSEKRQQASATSHIATQTVSAMKAAYQDWQPKISTIGNISAVNGVEVSPQVSGIVTSIAFQQGDLVEAGAILLQLYADDEIATLRSLQATAELAKTTYERDQRQFKTKGVSQQTLDADAAAVKEANANVAAQQALVDMKTVRAPFGGKLGIRQVDLGQYLDAGSAIVSLQSLDPVYLDFSIPQAQIGSISVGQAIRAKADAFAGDTFSGKILVINPEVDSETLNVRIRAELANPRQKLLPGMFVTLTLDTGKPVPYITVPQTAIASNPFGDIAYLLDPAKGEGSGSASLIARQVIVTIGDTRGDQVAIIKGIKEGDTVVTAGQIKLRNGTPVAINNTITPGFDPAPKPVDN